ncbi:PAQR family membrane homeostasis protein TrhA [Mesorhizobium yinganensis]|uniref:PAQR family membrane homeostasis protein TrhA n=1 Tax=Mesorhizobium yinganensis TaxID=3157707 RepID=UPI0032B77693
MKDFSGIDIPFRGRFAYSRAELIADGVVHAVGLVLAISAGSILLAFAAFRTGPWEYVATLLYVVSLLALMSISFAYNLWPVSPVKWKLRRLDHAAIYLLIAGTYTPFLAQLDDPALAGGMAALVWAAALTGMAIKIFLPGRFDRLSVVFYLAIGWSGAVAARTLGQTLPETTIWLIVAGGIAYSCGVVFFIWQRLKFQSAAWHCFVVLGAGLHLAAMMDCLVIARA